MTKLTYAPIILAVKKRKDYKVIGAVYGPDALHKTIMESLQNRVNSRYEALALVKEGAIFTTREILELAKEGNVDGIYIFDKKWMCVPPPFTELKEVKQ